MSNNLPPYHSINDVESADGEQLVKIRIWTGRPGHVSIETCDFYMSYWPTYRQPLLDIGNTVSARFHSLNDDNRVETRAAEHIYTLKLPLVPMAQQAISSKVLMLESGFLKWGIFTNGLANPRGKSYNCAGLAYQFLVNAGIEAKIQRPQFTWRYQLLQYVMLALITTTGVLHNKHHYKHNKAITTLLWLSVACFITMRLYALYVPIATCHPMTFALIPASPGRIKNLVVLAGGQEVHDDSAIAANPDFLPPIAAGKIDRSFIINLIQSISILHENTIAFFRTISPIDPDIGLIISSTNAGLLLVPDESNLKDCLEKGNAQLSEMMRLNKILLNRFDPSLMFLGLNTYNSQQMVQTENDVSRLNQFVARANRINISTYFQFIKEKNLFGALFARFPFLEKYEADITRQFMSNIPSRYEYLCTYSISSIKMILLVQLLAVLKNNLRYSLSKLEQSGTSNNPIAVPGQQARQPLLLSHNPLDPRL